MNAARWRVRAVARATAVSISTAACIIPDTSLRIAPQYDNPGAIRIVTPVRLTDQAHAACRDAEAELASCPVVPDTLPFGLVDFDSPFCRCPTRDGNALRFFDIFVEDPDIDEAGQAKDTLFGALLLDGTDSDDDPSSHLAYTNILAPTEPATLVQQSGFGTYLDAIGRPSPVLRSWTLGGESGVDLCNDNGSAPDGKLAVGLHTLRLVVTDRPWYRPVLRDAQGNVRRDAEGSILRKPIETARFGVPDTPSGASYDVADFVFRCFDSEVPESGCSCAEDGPS